MQIDFFFVFFKIKYALGQFHTRLQWILITLALTFPCLPQVNPPLLPTSPSSTVRYFVLKPIEFNTKWGWGLAHGVSACLALERIGVGSPASQEEK